MPGESQRCLIPDWNSPAYLDRFQALVQAIAARYRDDPHLAFVDVARVRSRWMNDGVAPATCATGRCSRSPGRCASRLPWASTCAGRCPASRSTTTRPLDLGAALPPGDYQVGLRVEDVEGVSPPVAVAMEGRGEDGTYLLGRLSLPWATAAGAPLRSGEGTRAGVAW